MSLDCPTMKATLNKLQEEFVFVPTDKAANNIAVVCKKFYVERSMQELDIFFQSTRRTLTKLMWRKRRILIPSLPDTEDIC